MTKPQTENPQYRSHSETEAPHLVCIQDVCVSYGVTRAQARNVLAMVPIADYRNRNNWYVADQVENVIAKIRYSWISAKTPR